MTIKVTTPPEIEPGKTYRAAIITDTAMGMAPSMAKIRTKLEDIGFTDVQVWDNPDDLPDDWTGDDRKDVSKFEQAQYWTRGVWGGKKTSDIPTKGEGWTLIWMYAEDGGQKFEQEAQPASYAWVPTTLTVGILGVAIWLWASGSKER